MKRLILAASLIALAPSAFADDAYSQAETDNTESAVTIQPDSEAASGGSASDAETNAEEASTGEESDSSSSRDLDV